MIKIENIQLNGSIDAVSSKSMAHRYLICSALSDFSSLLYIPNISDDIKMTIDCLKKLGADIKIDGRILKVIPINIDKLKKINEVLKFDMGESGTTFRFMLPVITSLLDRCEFSGRGRLPQRPIKELVDILKKSGCLISSDKLPFKITNKFRFNNVDIRGDISSQYISGLLLCAPMQNEDVRIDIISKLESKPYVDMTIDVMKKYGIEVVQEKKSYFISKNNKYTNKGISDIIQKIEGDWSNVAFFLVAGAIGSKQVEIKGLNLNSVQGDMKILEILKKIGAKVDIDINSGVVKISKHTLEPTEIDICDIPDLLPILTVLASACIGKTRFYNISRLRLKESDRIKSSVDMINSLGGIATEEENSLVIEGKGYLKGGEVSSYNDHRIAMSSTIASIICENPVILDEENAVNKSYVNFYEDFEKLGGRYVIIDRK